MEKPDGSSTEACCWAHTELEAVDADGLRIQLRVADWQTQFELREEILPWEEIPPDPLMLGTWTFHEHYCRD